MNARDRSPVFLSYLIVCLITCHSWTANAKEAPAATLITGDGSALGKQRAAIEVGEPKALSDLKKLVTKADRIISKGPLSVTDKTQIPPSGDKHDYLSLGPYWWPDPEKSDGLPFIRKDGRINPRTRGEHVDHGRKDRFFDSMRTLSRAAYLSGESKYGVAGTKFLEHWFINPETRMNPNLNYAQGIPGRIDGRSAGIIEWCSVDRVLSSIQILRALGYLSDETDQAVVKWFEEYASWLQTSEIGIDARNAKNNHGTYYDGQLVGILLFLGKEDEAKCHLDEVSRKRIASQIEPDGRQPHELKRTKSLTYSKMNIKGFMKLVNYGKRTGIDLWDYETPDGRSIHKAIEFLKPYIEGKKKWPYQQI